MRLNLLSLAVFIPAIVELLLASAGWHRRDRQGAKAFSAFMLACSIYSFGYALELSSTELREMLQWIRLEYLGIAVMPALWIIFAVQYAGRDKWLTRRTCLFLFAIPAFTLFACYTNEYWHLLYRAVGVSHTGPFPMLAVTGGIAYRIHMSYANVAFLLGGLMFLKVRLSAAPPYRRQADAVLLSSLVPWVGNLIYLSGYGPWNLDLDPFAFAIAGGGCVWGLLRCGFLDLVPVARATVFGGMSDGVLVLDMQNRILDMNPAAARLVGAAESGIGLPAAAVLNLGSEIRDRILHCVGGRLEVMHGSPEKPVWLEMNVSPLPDPRGVARGRLIVIRDVTERKRVEEERLDMERRLLHAQRLESLGVLAGGIAHDFNNLLMVVLGNLELAQTLIPASSPAHSNIADAVAAATRASDISRQMLAYSGKNTIRKEALNLAELVQDMLNLLRISISKNAVLDLRLTRELPLIMADPGQIRQVVMNIIINASEAIGAQSGAITVTMDAPDCDEQTLMLSRLEEKPPAGAFVRLRVSDTGCGMDEQTRQLLFDPYFSTKFTGRGLGMSAVLGIVRGHHGAIMVESEPGRGTTFSVLFPVADVAEVSLKPLKDENPRTAGECRSPSLDTVLVVDDEEMVRDLCAATVEQLGFRVLSAADGEEALEVFRAHADEISCVIVDLTMPGMDGPTVLKHLSGVRPGVKVILSSGYSLRDIPRLISEGGFAGFLEKPYTMQNLDDELHRVLKSRCGVP